MNLTLHYLVRQQLAPETADGPAPRAPLVAAGLACHDLPSYQERNLGEELGGTLSAMRAVAPETLALERQYRPQYLGLDLESLRDFLRGTGGAPGAVALESEATRAGRAADVADLAQLGPGALEALKAANPSQAALLDELNASALNELKYGRALTPDQLHTMEQSVRTGAASRGLGYGPNAVLLESLGKQELGEELLRRRRQAAGGAAELSDRSYSNPIREILARRSGGNLVAPGFNAGRTAGPSLFDPMNQYASQLYGGNQEAYNQNQMARAGVRNALYGSLAQGGVTLLGGAMTGLGI